MTDAHHAGNASVIDRTRVPLNAGFLKLVFSATSNLFAKMFPAPGWVGSGGFAMESQCHSNWCWASVAQAVVRGYHPAATCTQRMLAERFVDKNLGGALPYDAPCIDLYDPDAVKQDDGLRYNRMGLLFSMLFDMDCFDHPEPNPGGPGPADLPKVQEWIQNKDANPPDPRVVCVRIQWPGGGDDGHFVLIDGFLPGTQKLHVRDPWYAPEGNEVTHAELVSNYHLKGGSWSHTLYTRRSKQSPSTICSGS